MFILFSLQKSRFQEVWFDICILLVVDNVLLSYRFRKKVTKNRQNRRLFYDVTQICFISGTVKVLVSTCYRLIPFFNDIYALRYLTLGSNFLYHYFK